MAGKRGKRFNFKKFLIPLLKWISALVPVAGFIYVLYYYKQFDFLLKEKPVVVTRTEEIGSSDSLLLVTSGKERLLREIRIMENEWHTVGGIAIHSLTLENSTNLTIKETEIEFKYLSNTQSVVTSKIVTIRTPLPPKKSTKISGISVGYVNNVVVGCDVKVVNATL
ncbi:hypothetical protein [Dyadobacter sandarakinus]|uniref:LPS export ABC transporter periplasmic protein LptC n=1 Tax=Dyadobacter sandarakinus TaxID=2747268 RepID=A0ABX7IER2_9BACT|nr:hypothetical protein [Dyadobacter sandarakinus]QRR03912.1 hypothetical protein HWI92_24865 [Dyadobacter sandarakinus]